MKPSRWTLMMDGKGTLVRPDGLVIPLPYRQVAELLAILFRQPLRTANREDLARWIWPCSSKTERMTSLRQSLSRLRTALGEGILETDRQTCRLASSFDLEIRGEAAIEIGATTPPMAAPSFGDLVERVASADPDRALSLLNDNPDAGLGTAPNQLDRICQTLAGTPKLTGQLGWLSFWRGIAVVPGEVGRANRHFEAGRNWSIQRQEWKLLSYASYWLGVGRILEGDLHAASKIASQASHLLQHRSADGLGRIRNLQAHVDLHMGRTEAAIDQLAALTFDDRLPKDEHLRSQSLRALYLAYAGKAAEAEKMLERLAGTMTSASHTQIQGYCDLAGAVIQTLDYKSESFNRAEYLAESFAARSDVQLELYTRELLAVRARERGKPHLARPHMPRIRSLRRSIGLVYTDWDRQRLTPTARL